MASLKFYVILLMLWLTTSLSCSRPINTSSENNGQLEWQQTIVKLREKARSLQDMFDSESQESFGHQQGTDRVSPGGPDPHHHWDIMLVAPYARVYSSYPLVHALTICAWTILILLTSSQKYGLYNQDQISFHILIPATSSWFFLTFPLWWKNRSTKGGKKSQKKKT